MFTIYKITNLIDMRAYVGVTTMALEKRTYNHVQRKTLIGAAIAEHGIENFRVETLETHATKEDAYNAEDLAIRTHGTHAPGGYNRRVRGGKYPGCGGAGPGNVNSRRRAVSSHTFTGRLIETYPTVMDAAKALGIQRNTIHRAITNPHYTAGGYHWKDAVEPVSHGG